MADNDEADAALAQWCEAMGKLLALPLDQGDRNEIVANLRILARQMELLSDFALDDHEEPAPQFRV